AGIAPLPLRMKALSAASSAKCSSSLASDGPKPLAPPGWQVLQLRIKICSPFKLVDVAAWCSSSALRTASMRFTSSDIEQPATWVAANNDMIAVGSRLLCTQVLFTLGIARLSQFNIHPFTH